MVLAFINVIRQQPEIERIITKRLEIVIVKNRNKWKSHLNTDIEYIDFNDFFLIWSHSFYILSKSFSYRHFYNGKKRVKSFLFFIRNDFFIYLRMLCWANCLLSGVCLPNAKCIQLKRCGAKLLINEWIIIIITLRKWMPIYRARCWKSWNQIK